MSAAQAIKIDSDFKSRPLNTIEEYFAGKAEQEYEACTGMMNHSDFMREVKTWK